MFRSWHCHRQYAALRTSGTGPAEPRPDCQTGRSRPLRTRQRNKGRTTKNSGRPSLHPKGSLHVRTRLHTAQRSTHRVLQFTRQTRQTQKTGTRRRHEKTSRHPQHHDQKSTILEHSNTQHLNSFKTADGTVFSIAETQSIMIFNAHRDPAAQ